MWQALTQLIQQANVRQDKNEIESTWLNGKRTARNLIKKTLSGRLEWSQLGLVPVASKLCRVDTTAAGFMLVLHVQKDRGVQLHDSTDDNSQSVWAADFSWIVRWLFIRRCFRGHF